jgi:hypothetical protein
VNSPTISRHTDDDDGGDDDDDGDDDNDCDFHRPKSELLPHKCAALCKIIPVKSLVIGIVVLECQRITFYSFPYYKCHYYTCSTIYNLHINLQLLTSYHHSRLSKHFICSSCCYYLKILLKET